MQPLELDKPWEQLSTLLDTDDPQQVTAFLDKQDRDKARTNKKGLTGEIL